MYDRKVEVGAEHLALQQAIHGGVDGHVHEPALVEHARKLVPWGDVCTNRAGSPL